LYSKYDPEASSMKYIDIFSHTAEACLVEGEISNLGLP